MKERKTNPMRVRLEPSLYERAQKVAKALKITDSELIRRALEEYIQSVNKLPQSEVPSTIVVTPEKYKAVQVLVATSKNIARWSRGKRPTDSDISHAMNITLAEVVELRQLSQSDLEVKEDDA